MLEWVSKVPSGTRLDAYVVTAPHQNRSVEVDLRDPEKLLSSALLV
jgi:hypothetical protein